MVVKVNCIRKTITHSHTHTHLHNNASKASHCVLHIFFIISSKYTIHPVTTKKKIPLTVSHKHIRINYFKN